MPRKSVSATLAEISAEPDVNRRIAALRAVPALTPLLQGAMHPGIKWLIPEGSPPFRPNMFPDQDSALWQELRRLYLFVEGGHKTLSQARRESLFIDILEAVNTEDAALMIAAKDKKLPYPGITPEVVRAAFPGLLGQDEPAPKRRRRGQKSV